MSTQGALRFAQYAYPPNELGYCGPRGARAMLDPAATAEIERRARLFEGAWSYLEVLAEAAEVADLLDAVDPGALVARLEDRFRGQVGGSWREASARASAHHSFQVFEVYPWAGLLRQGRPPGPAVNVLDRCRVRVGDVLAVDGEQVTVRASLLAWDGSTLRRTGPSVEQARWSVEGRALIDTPRVGDTVTLHWDWVCDVVTADAARRVVALEAATLDGIGLAGTGPAGIGLAGIGPAGQPSAGDLGEVGRAVG